MKKNEPEDSSELKQAAKKRKQPQHVAVAKRHLVLQYEKACCAHAELAEEIKELVAALTPLGWPEE